MVEDENENITLDINLIYKITMTYFKNSYFIKLENKMDKFLDAYNIPKLCQYEINHLIRFIAVDKTKASKENLGPNRLAYEFYHFFKKRTKTKLFQFFS